MNRADQLSHAGAELELTGSHKGGVMALLAGLQIRHQRGLGRGPLQLRQGCGDAFAAAADGQQLAVTIFIPAQGHAQLSKGPVEGEPMAVALRLGQGAIDVPEQGLQGHRLVLQTQRRLRGCIRAAGAAQWLGPGCAVVAACP